MLRDEVQIALNDVVIACQEAADGHEAVAARVDDASFAELLRELAVERRAAAEALAEQVRALGDLPRIPDSDMETLREAVSAMKAMFAPEPGRTLVEERLAAEAALEQAVADALKRSDLPAGARQPLEQLRDSVAQAPQRLDRAATGD